MWRRMSGNNKPLIMIVDDNPENIKYLAEIVNRNGYDYIMLLNGTQALKSLEIERPDLILLDVMMPDIDGYTVCSQIKKNDEIKDIPIIFITAKTEINDIVKGFEIGGVDYVTKPFNSIVLEARIKTHLELKSSKDELKESINEQKEINERLKKEVERCEFLANRDALTGIYNRRYMMERLKEEYIKFKRNGESLTIGIMDLDDFKKFNDTYGHECGDFVLISITELILNNIRGSDCFARWGGEEFIFMLSNTNLVGASTLLNKIKKKLNETVFCYNGIELKVSFTCGLSEVSLINNIDKALVNADKALYVGKNSGKNKVVCYDMVLDT
jgi:two-component system, cell cycle response regulator